MSIFKVSDRQRDVIRYAPGVLIYDSQPAEATAIDTYLRTDNPTTNNGSDVLLAVGDDATLSPQVYRTLIKYDLSPIPVNSVILFASLFLTTERDRSTTTRDYKIYRVLRDWVELQATQNIWKTANNWTTPGAGSNGNDVDYSTIWATTSFGPTIANNTPMEFAFSPTGLIELSKYVDGINPNYGWMIKADTELADAYFFHSSNAVTSSFRPRLLIKYIPAP